MILDWQSEVGGRADAVRRFGRRAGARVTSLDLGKEVARQTDGSARSRVAGNQIAGGMAMSNAEGQTPNSARYLMVWLW